MIQFSFFCTVADAEIPVVLCSRNHKPAWCQDVIEQYKLPDGRFFSEICHPASMIRPAYSKIEHLKHIQNHLGCKYEELLFFDDEARICFEARGLGVKAICVTKAGIHHIFSLITLSQHLISFIFL